jgi:hypothetical protein
MKKLSLFIVLMFLVSLFAISVFADGTASGGEELACFPDESGECKGVFEGIVKQVKGFFGLVLGTATGTYTIENTPGLQIIGAVLYFIVFMAIFTEGLKKIKFFGDSGSLSTPGKWFAFAAASLSTLALFIIQVKEGQSVEQVLTGLIGPFGVWGGVAIAGLVAYITYTALKDMEMFGGWGPGLMATSGAIGVTMAGYLLSKPMLVSWGFMIILVALGVGMFGVFGGGLRQHREKEYSAFQGNVTQRRTEFAPVTSDLGDAKGKLDDYKSGSNLEADRNAAASKVDDAITKLSALGQAASTSTLSAISRNIKGLNKTAANTADADKYRTEIEAFERRISGYIGGAKKI